MRSPQNVLESLSSKACNSNYRYQRLYRNLYNPEFYLIAYQKIQAKQGNMTAGTDGKTVDGIGMKRINALIARLKDFSYQPAPARRTYIPKANGKKRPLGIPSFDDKLVQEVVRMILESIYEPTFLNTSHGFRPKRSCHTALQYVQKNFTGVKWFVEGDIKGCFDHVDHHALVNILRRRIQDEHFIGLIWKFLKAGYMENWVYHNTYSGTPQGSIISPILANIYLNELDVFMAQYAQTFRQGNKRRINPAYKKPLDKRRGKQEWLKRNESKISPEQKATVMAEINEINQYLRTIPYVDPMDDSYKRLVYVRYADDFLIGVIGSKADAKQVKIDVGRFIREQLHLELSQEKTLITHGTDFAQFLSFQITTSKEQNSTRTKAGYVKRSYTGRIKLYVPKEKWLKRLPGEPDTLRGVCPVRRGAFGNLPPKCGKALGAYPTCDGYRTCTAGQLCRTALQQHRRGLFEKLHRHLPGGLCDCIGLCDFLRLRLDPARHSGQLSRSSHHCVELCWRTDFQYAGAGGGHQDERPAHPGADGPVNITVPPYPLWMSPPPWPAVHAGQAASLRRAQPVHPPELQPPSAPASPPKRGRLRRPGGEGCRPQAPCGPDTSRGTR